MNDAAHSDEPADENTRAGLPATGAEPRAQTLTLAYIDSAFDKSARGAEAEAETSWTSVQPKRDWRRLRAVASLVAVVAIGGVAAAAHVHALRVADADQTQATSLQSRFDAMKGRLDSLEANRSRDELANMRKVLAEIKAGAAGSRDVSGAIGQLASRVDKLEKEQTARLDKLGDRIDHDSATRLAEVVARLDKLEARTNTPVATAAKPSPALKSSTTKPDSGISYESTSAVKATARLHGYYLSEVHNGYAMIDSPAGEFAVAPGDTVPGGGRVLRIERHGHEWAVVTTQGEIVSDDE